MEEVSRRIVVIGDTHDQRRRLDAVIGFIDDQRVDLALLVGDLGQDVHLLYESARHDRTAHDESIRYVLARVKDRLNCPVLFVPGNHDLSDPPADVVGSNADGRIVEQAGLRIAGFGGAGPKAFGFPYEWTEPEAGASLDKLLSGGQGEIDIFLCHTPPLDTKLDLTASGEHVGSSAVAAWIERVRPTFFVCGHIHEAWGVERFGRTPCLNAGALGEPYGQEIVWIVEWRDGPIRVESRRRSPEGAVAQHVWRFLDELQACPFHLLDPALPATVDGHSSRSDGQDRRRTGPDSLRPGQPP